MDENPDPGPSPALPWWRVGIMWLVIAGPIAVVLAGVVTFVLAVRGADPPVDAGATMTPALQARNHAAEPKR